MLYNQTFRDFSPHFSRAEKRSVFLTNSCFGSHHIKNGKQPVVKKMLMVLQGTGM